MAVIKFGSVVTGGRGSLGGSTIQPDHSGHIWRNKPFPTKSRTQAQSVIRSINKTMQAGWRSLSDQDRKVWNDYSINKPVLNRSGEKHPLSGHSLWLKYQFPYLYYGLPLQSNVYKAATGPFGPELIASLHVEATWTTYSWDGSDIAATQTVIGNPRSVTDLIDAVGKPGEQFMFFYTSHILNAGTLPLIRFCVCSTGFCSGNSNAVVDPKALGGYYPLTILTNDPVYFQFFVYNSTTDFAFTGVSVKRILT